MVREDVASLMRAMAEAVAPYERLGAEEARRATAANRAKAAIKRPPLGSVIDRTLTFGDHVVPVRVYRLNPEVEAPVVVFVHGGGWVICDLDSHDVLCRRIVKASGCTVVSVDYRLAPEHPFPKGLEDVEQVLAWTLENRRELGGARYGTGIAGDSAGANLALVAALGARQAPNPVDAVALLYPVTDGGLDTQSYRDLGTGFPLTRNTMAWFWDQYLDDPDDRFDSRASPLRTPDVSGLAATLVITAGLDPLRDEGIEMAQRLLDAGVSVTSRHFDEVFHGFASVEALAESATAVDLVARHFRRELIETAAASRL